MQVTFKGLEYGDLRTYKVLTSAVRGSYSPEPTRENGYRSGPEGVRKPVADALAAIDGAAGCYDVITIKNTKTIPGQNYKDDKYFLRITSPNGETISENYVTREELDNKKPGSRVEEVFTQFAKDTKEYMENYRHHEPETPQEVMKRFTHKYAPHYWVYNLYKVEDATEYLNAKIISVAKGEGRHFEPFIDLDDIRDLVDPDDID